MQETTNVFSDRLEEKETKSETSETLLICISFVEKEICKGWLQRIFNHVAGI